MLECKVKAFTWFDQHCMFRIWIHALLCNTLDWDIIYMPACEDAVEDAPDAPGESFSPGA